MNRQQILDHIKQKPDMSVLIIGGGINGLGTFRDLALQGVDVLLVEKGDFCSGASAGSSHMVHGGIRYLENGEFRLVREAVHERNRLIKNAPQYVRPLATTIPIFKHLSGLLNAPLKFLNLLDRPGERGSLVIKMGLMMYDAYTKEQGSDAVQTHDFMGKQESLRKFPKLNNNIVATATYYDAAMPSPERIALEVMLDGADAGDHANAVNYLSAVGASGDEVHLKDEMTGDEYTVRPQLVINAAGPWIDFANKALGKDTNFIGGTKGSHLVLDHPELYEATRGNEIFFENDDGRIVLIYPLMDRVIVGTTDIPIDNPDDAVCTEEEREYFFELIDKVFPTIDVNKSHIVYEFSGVRPLPSSDANTTGQISRDHENRVVEPGSGHSFPIFNLIGGKWTTFRAFSEHVADDALARLNHTRRTDTKQRPIGGGVDYPRADADRHAWIAEVAGKTGLTETRVRQLFEKYGTRAERVAQYISEGEDQILESKPNYSVREIEFLCHNEMVVRLTDFFQRRTLLAMMGRLSYPLILEAADAIAAALEWSDDKKQKEIDFFLALLREQHNVHFAEAGQAA